MRKHARWKKLQSPTEENLRAVWGTSEEHIVAVGDNCTALEFNGETEPPEDGGEKPPDLRVLSADSCSNFWGMDGHGAGAALVVGDGTIQRYNGQKLVNAGNCGDRLLGVSFPKDGLIVAVGDMGVMCSKAGDSWQSEEIALCPVSLVEGECPVDAMKPILWDVWVGESGNGALVGTFGGLWHYPKPESGWEPVDTGLDGEIHSVHGRDLDGDEGDTEIYAVGNYGVVLKVRGKKVIREAVGTNEHLNGVWVSEDGKHAYAVGNNGTIAHLSR
jgi:hypothetical protein